MKKAIKNILFGTGTVQRIKAGIGKDLLMNIDVSNKAQRILGLDEFEIQEFVRTYSRRAECFFDIGASDGYYSLLFRKHNENGTIFMFEAQNRFKYEISENFSLNNFPTNYHHFPKFASDRMDDDNITLDSVFHENKKVLFFKIDVDGAEELVLKGMQKTLKNNHCLFIIETHSKELEENCIAFLSAHGYSIRIIDHAWFRLFLPEERVIEHNRWLIAEKDC
jgi:hypothetical protein